MAYGNPGAGSRTTRSCWRIWPRVRRGVAAQIVNHYNVQPVFDVYANVDHQDLGSVGAAVRKIVTRRQAEAAARQRPSNVRGQIATMQSSFYRLGLG